MNSGWKRMLFSDAAQINPTRKLGRGEIAPYIEMAALPEFERKVRAVIPREYKGSGSRFTNHDTLLARITPCLENGKTVFVRELTENTVGWGSTEFIVLSGRENVTDNLFVYYLSTSPEFRDYAIQNMVGTSGRQRVDSACFDRLLIDVPPLPTQRRIAQILGRLDDKIEVNRRINRTLEVMAQALFKHWFVDFGPFQAGPFVESELGLIPEGWRVKKLGEVAQINSSSIVKGREPNEITYVDISSVSSGQINSFIPMLFSDAPSRARRLVKHGDTIWSAVRPNLRAFSLVQYPQENLVVSTGFSVIRPVSVPYSYVYTALSTQEFTDYLVSRATGAAYPAVTAVDFEQAPILVPDDTILSNFHKRVYPWLEQKYVLEQENHTLAATRDYLLPRLLSGEVAV